MAVTQHMNRVVKYKGEQNSTTEEPKACCICTSVKFSSTTPQIYAFALVLKN
ncbi:hypothetical protein Hsw_3144 [Hymenobacter swuensis DY53]|uniref:Uncharacterized protein n=1 Tax=Hymenobacter swuensis DY53 TaxID=1227739 RepID=W8F030_9BACT|nr:hypothetical protein Hsw_3144 [Hymenobacter swuensis DY53]